MTKLTALTEQIPAPGTSEETPKREVTVEADTYEDAYAAAAAALEDGWRLVWVRTVA